MAGVVKVDELLEHLGLNYEDLKTRCSVKDFKEIARGISNWEKYAHDLELGESEMEDIRTQAKRESRKMVLALLRWKEIFGFKATFEYLVNDVFLKNNDAEAAEKVCIQLKSMRLAW